MGKWHYFDFCPKFFPPCTYKSSEKGLFLRLELKNQSNIWIIFHTPQNGRLCSSTPCGVYNCQIHSNINKRVNTSKHPSNKIQTLKNFNCQSLNSENLHKNFSVCYLLPCLELKRKSRDEEVFVYSVKEGGIHSFQYNTLLIIFDPHLTGESHLDIIDVQS